MKSTSVLFSGILASFAIAWFGLVVVPQSQIGNLQPQVDEENQDVYPINIAGEANRGRQVYISEGCNYCHTQFVRDAHTGPDIEREWGTRRTVARDYIYDTPVTLGYMRNGPDLSNTGAPKSDESKRKYVSDPNWLYTHLYNPRSLVPESIMPAYRFLFEKREISGQRSDDAITLLGSDVVPDGYEVVPTPDAKALVAYLLSLDKTHPLNEVKGVAPAKASAK